MEDTTDKWIGAVSDHSEIDRNLSSLQETEGWKNLSPQQQKMIRTSLLLSNRAFRETDPASADAIGNDVFKRGTPPMIYREEKMTGEHSTFRKVNPAKSGIASLEYKHDPATRKYRGSQNLIASLNCHESIRSLEESRFDTAEPEKVDPNYFDANYKNIGSWDDPNQLQNLKANIVEAGFPSVVIHNDSRNNTMNSPQFGSEHSFLAMGIDKSGEILCWDKEDFGRPFRVLRLSEMLKRGKSEPFWGTRKLRDIA